MNRRLPYDRSLRLYHALAVCLLMLGLGVAVRSAWPGILPVERATQADHAALSSPSSPSLPSAAEADQFRTGAADGIGAVPYYRRTLNGFVPAVPIRIIDGDTVEMRVSIWLGQEVVTRVRMRGIDAPELKARCDEELSKAQAAKQALQDLLSEGDFYLTEIGYDKYGTRVVARIVDAQHADLGQILLQRELARPYSGGKRQGWCR